MRPELTTPSGVTGRRPRVPNPFWLVLVGFSAAGVALRAAIPPVIQWQSPHDDEVLMRFAAAILDGRWLGAWGEQPVAHITMAKTPGYSLFLAGIHGTGLTPPVAAYLLYLVGAALVALSARAFLTARWAGVMFAVLALNPSVFHFNFSRVYRDQLVVALALLVLGLAIHAATTVTRPGPWRWHRWLLVVSEVIALGLAGALLTVTRSDVQWIVLAATGAVVAVLLPHARRLGLRSWLVVGLGLALVLALSAAGPQGVRLLNERYYQVPLTNDYSEGELARAVTVWASIEAEPRVPFVLVDAAQREAAYAVSPTAAELRDWIEGDALRWREFSCDLQSSTLVDCNEYYGYFAWALRDAAWLNGVGSPAELQDYFGRLADELTEACDAGDLTCGVPAVSPDVPALHLLSPRAVGATFASLVHTSVTRPAASGGAQPAAPDAPVTQLWIETVHGAESVRALTSIGVQQASVTLSPAYLFLQSLVVWFTTPLALAALVLLFTRSTWATTTGRVALAALAGWMGNLAIVALFYGGSNRDVVSTHPIYIAASRSYLLIGLVLVAALAWHLLADHLARPAAPAVEKEDA